MFTVSKLVSRGWVPQFSTRRAGHYNAQMCFHAAMIKKKDHGLMTIMRTPRTPPLQYPLDQLHHGISYLYAFVLALNASCQNRFTEPTLSRIPG